MKPKKNKKSASITDIFKEGDLKVRLSFLIMGLGIFFHKQKIKGLIILLMEISFISFMINVGIKNLAMLPSLGTETQGKVWNEAKQIFEYSQGDNSQIILLYGVATLFAIMAFLFLWYIQIKHSYKLQKMEENNKKITNIKEDIKNLFDGNIHITLMTLPMLGLLIFNIVPLVYMISMAFTSYSKEGNSLILFDWNGLTQFKRVLNLKGNIGKQFGTVLTWTITWAVLATFLNYILGMLLALIINRKDTKFKGFWRFCFILSVAIPQFVSLMVVNIILQPQGAVNVLLQNMGLISSPIPFWSNATLAKITIVIVNLWVGIPYTLLQVTGILKNIPQELYEAAKIDGANSRQIFFKITLPYMLFITTPYLIVQFVGNINNFNIIYLLSGGGPTYVGDTAGQTDLLVTWLYKLTIDNQYYNLGAVIGILTFVLLTGITLFTYRRTAAYNDEEGFM